MPHHQSRSRTVAQRTCDAAGSEAAAAHRRGIAASPVLADEFDVGLLRHMSAHERRAVAEFASQMQTSETSIRQRVSGGLSALRAYRAAQELARQDRAVPLRRRPWGRPVLDRPARAPGLLFIGQPDPGSRRSVRTRAGLDVAPFR
jgi:hypothetical protein